MSLRGAIAMWQSRLDKSGGDCRAIALNDICFFIVAHSYKQSTNQFWFKRLVANICKCLCWLKGRYVRWHVKYLLVFGSIIIRLIKCTVRRSNHRFNKNSDTNN